jgi:ribosomal-protein-alanine acetyltransferase
MKNDKIFASNRIDENLVEIQDFESGQENLLFDIHIAVMPKNDQMTKQNFLNEFCESSRKYFVALIGKEIVGYVGLFDCGEDENIIGIAVKKPFQNNGIGTKLMKKAVNFALKQNKKSLSLEVDESNLGAKNFYEKMLFVVTNIRKNYYKGSDAYVMFRYL